MSTAPSIARAMRSLRSRVKRCEPLPIAVLQGWVVILTFAPPAVTSGPLITPVAIVTVPSVRLLRKNDGLKTRSTICWAWCTSTWCSPFQPNCIRCFSAATERCTICCFGQSPKRCPSLLQIGSTWEPESGLLLSCTPVIPTLMLFRLFLHAKKKGRKHDYSQDCIL